LLRASGFAFLDGSVQKLSAVRWGMAGGIVWAWILTIRASATIAALAGSLGRLVI
jgi:PiT family inorganic phosphate transporter